MNTSTPNTPQAPGISWRAILAGAIVALSVHLLLTTLGAAITALAAKPSNTDSPGQAITIGLAISWTLSALVSLWLGGCLTAKIAAAGNRESGQMHGFVMWSLATVIGFVLVTMGVGKALGMAGQVAGGAAKTVAAAVPDLAKKSGEMIDQYAGEVAPAGKQLTGAEKREVAMNLKNLLLNAEAGRTPQNREALVNVVARVSGQTPEQAGKTVDEWTASYDRAKAEISAEVDAAAKKAKEVAEHSASVAGSAGIWTFVAFWIGAVAAVWGGRCGAEGCTPGTLRSPKQGVTV